MSGSMKLRVQTQTKTKLMFEKLIDSDRLIVFRSQPCDKFWKVGIKLIGAFWAGTDVHQEDEPVETLLVFCFVVFYSLQDLIAGDVVFHRRRCVVGVRAGAGGEIY